MSRVLVLHCAAIAAVVAIGGGGCYAPAPPSGAYGCGDDGACPSGQRCVCGQCVARPDEAACAFTAVARVPACTETVPVPAAPRFCVHEHEHFPIELTALQADKATPATNFHAAVTVTSSWGDAYLHDAPVRFDGGRATITVSLNRETLGQSKARVTVHAGTATGTTDGIAIVANRLTAEKPAILQPAGWANLIVTEPDVVRDDGGALRMYFAGAGVAGGRPVSGIGLATSDDGRSFTMQAAPLLQSPQGDFGKDSLTGPAVFRGASGDWRMIFRGANPQSDQSDFGLALSGDGLTGWALVSPTAVLNRMSCNFCKGSVDFPSVLPSPDAPPGTLDLYFAPGLAVLSTDAVGHAVSNDDGLSWDVDPLKLPLQGLQSNEAVIGAPQVVREGSVYKMFYAYTNSLPLVVPILACPQGLKFDIGYATSEDGVLFIRSPSNPVLTGAPAWAPSAALVPGRPVLVDPADPTRGIALYYTVIQTVDAPAGIHLCLPSGIGRATRP